jgi:hypothetical protein
MLSATRIAGQVKLDSFVALAYAKVGAPFPSGVP